MVRTAKSSPEVLLFKTDLSHHERDTDYLPVFIPTLKKANTHSNHDHVKPGGNSCNLLSHFHLSNKSIITISQVARMENVFLEFRSEGTGEPVK